MGTAESRAKALYERKLYGAALTELATARMEADRAGRTADLVTALNGSFLCADSLRLSEAGLRFTRMGVEAGEEVGYRHPATLNAFFNHAIASAKLGHFERAKSAIAVIEDASKGLCGEADEVMRARTRLLKFDVLLDSGDFEEARRCERKLDGAPLDQAWTTLLAHSRALLAAETGDPERAIEVLTGVLEDYRRDRDDRGTLSSLADLAQAYAMAMNPDGVALAIREADGILGSAPCALDAVEIGRLAALSALGLAMAGQLKDLRRRLEQVTLLLGGIGRADEARRLCQRVIQVSTRFAGYLSDLQTPAQPLFGFFEAPYVLWRNFADERLAPLAVYVRAIGPRLSEAVDTCILEQAASVPFTETSWRVRGLSEGLTGHGNHPPEAKVLAVLKDYANGVAREPYDQVLSHLWRQRGERYDEEIVTSLVDLHTA